MLAHFRPVARREIAPRNRQGASCPVSGAGLDATQRGRRSSGDHAESRLDMRARPLRDIACRAALERSL